MSQTREDIEHKSSPTFSAFMSTFLSQPIRVMLSRAQKDFWPWETLVNGWKSVGNGLPINLLRGTTSTASAAYAKQYAGYYVEGKHPWVAMGAMLTASSVAEMLVAYSFETIFIRKSNLDNKNMFKGVKYSPFNFAPVLVPLYLIRGIGFGSIVFYSNHLPPIQQNAILVAGTSFTAIAQKFIGTVAISDIMRHEGTVPDFREGIMKTLKNVARGDYYTHPSYKGYYSNPATLPKLIANFAYIGCNPSMFTWRLSYLYFVKFVFNEVESKSPTILARLSMFAGNNETMMASLLTESERDLMIDTDHQRSSFKRG